MNRKEHPDEVCEAYNLIAESQSNGDVCMLICRPGSKPNLEQLKSRGVVLSDLMIWHAKDGDEVRMAIETSTNTEARTFVI